MNTRKIGTIGEYISCEYLKENAYKILDRNFYCREGEIDIVAKDTSKTPEEYCFIEVKTRSNSKYGRPVEAVNDIKKKHILSASKYYLYKKHLYKKFIRYDVIEVYKNQEKYLINHIKNCNIL